MSIVRLLPAVLFGFVCGGVSGDTFNWVTTEGTWSTPANWVTTSERSYPNAAGDVVKIGPASMTVDGDYTVGKLSITNVTTLVSDGSVRTITLDSGSPDAPAELFGHLVDWKSAQNSYIGAKPSDDNLILNLSSPLSIYNTGNNSTKQYFWIPAKITGGSDDSLCDLTFVWKWGWGEGCVILMNPGNDFRGDIHVGCTAGSDGKAYLSAGGADARFSNSILGDADNEIYLSSRNGTLNAILAISRADTTGILDRKIHGRGTVAGFNRYETYTNSGDLHFGPNALIDPGTGTDAADEIAVTGSSITMDAATTFRLTLGASFGDKVSFTPTKALSFTGAVEFDYATSSADIPGASTFDIFTVSAVNFSFKPSSFPAGFSYSVAGDANSGWTVTAIKNAEWALAQSLDTTLVGDTYATLNANVSMPDSGAVDTSVRFYYGMTDGGSDAAAWEHYIDCPATVTAAGPVSVAISGLTLDGTYYARAAVTSVGHTEFAATTVSFTTRALSAANTFTWLATNDAWSVADNWFNPTCYARLVPGCTGDKVIVDVSGTNGKAIYLSTDQAVGSVEVRLASGSYNVPAGLYAFENPVTLTFDSGSAGVTSRVVTTTSNPQVRFGNHTETNKLTVALSGPLEISCPNESGGNSTYVYCKLTGGTAANPCPVFVSAHDNYWRISALYLDEETNDFVGDIYVGSAVASQGRCYLYVGGSDIRTDAVLGDAANRVILRNTSWLTYFGDWRNKSATCNRTVIGNGTVRSAQAVNGNVADNQLYPLVLSSSARIEPQGASGTGYGTISFLAKSLSLDDGATVTLDLDPAGGSGDAIAVDVREPFTLGGTLVVSEASAKAKGGATWTIATVSAKATEFVNDWRRPAGYDMTTSGDATNGWTVTLTKRPSALSLFVR